MILKDHLNVRTYVSILSKMIVMHISLIDDHVRIYIQCVIDLGIHIYCHHDMYTMYVHLLELSIIKKSCVSKVY